MAGLLLQTGAVAMPVIMKGRNFRKHSQGDFICPPCACTIMDIMEVDIARLAENQLHFAVLLIYLGDGDRAHRTRFTITSTARRIGHNPKILGAK
jgi:hypothetical protein